MNKDFNLLGGLTIEILTNYLVNYKEYLIDASYMLLLMFIVYNTYKKVSSLQYDYTFNLNLMITILIVNLLITVIDHNVATSLGLLGVLSIVRFRMKLKNHLEISFLFWAIGVGVSLGKNFYILGIGYSLIIAGILLVFNRRTQIEK